MTNISHSAGISILFLSGALLLTACHSTPERTATPLPTELAQSKPSENVIDPTKALFPMDNYPQRTEQWIPPGPTYHQPLLSPATQKIYFAQLKKHYFGMTRGEPGPWNPHYITGQLHKKAEQDRAENLDTWLGQHQRTWGENFRLHSAEWKQDIRYNASREIEKVYHPKMRGITLKETLIRLLPTDDPAFGDPRRAGEGYPFDNLQASSLHPGTPIYILTTSRDQRWAYVLAPTVTGWVHSDDIARTNPKFVNTWLTLARKNLGSVIRQSVTFGRDNQFYFTGGPGTLLPFKPTSSGTYRVATPVADKDGHATIQWVPLKHDVFAEMPWAMTPQHIAVLLKTMAGRPYGWGNSYFYNDCSAEIRNILLPFGLFLPRNSAAQIAAVTRIEDLSHENTETRLRYLTEKGKPFTTLVYIQGHIMLYIGNTTLNGKVVPMTYQNIWGLRPEHTDGRSIIGGAVFFPLLATYPEDKNLVSLASKPIFKLGFIE